MTDVPSSDAESLVELLPVSVIHPQADEPLEIDEFCDDTIFTREDLRGNRVCSFTLELADESPGISTHVHPTITAYEHDTAGYLVTVTVAPEFIVLAAFTMHMDPQAFIAVLIAQYHMADDVQVDDVCDVRGRDEFTDLIEQVPDKLTTDTATA